MESPMDTIPSPDDAGRRAGRQGTRHKTILAMRRTRRGQKQKKYLAMGLQNGWKLKLVIKSVDLEMKWSSGPTYV